MKNATQPNGISLTPGNCSSATRSWLDRSETPVLIELRPAAQTGAGAGLVAARALQVDGPDPEQRPVGPVGKRLLVDVERDQGHPAEAVRAPHDQRQVRHHAQDRPPALLDFFELGDHHRRRAGRRDRLVRAGEGIECLERRHLLLTAGQVPAGSAPRTLSRTACQLAPTATTRWPPRSTQSTSGWPRSASSAAIVSRSPVSTTMARAAS